MHVLAVVQEAEYLEYCVEDTPLNRVLVAEHFPVDATEGGNSTDARARRELDEEVLENYRVKGPRG